MSRNINEETSISLEKMVEIERGRNPDFAAVHDASTARRNIATAMVRARLRARLSASQVARNMGVDRAYISRLESAQGGMPDPETFRRYIAACDPDAQVGYVVISGTPLNLRVVDTVELAFGNVEAHYFDRLNNLSLPDEPTPEPPRPIKIGF